MVKPLLTLRRHVVSEMADVSLFKKNCKAEVGHLTIKLPLFIILRAMMLVTFYFAISVNVYFNSLVVTRLTCPIHVSQAHSLMYVTSIN